VDIKEYMSPIIAPVEVEIKPPLKTPVDQGYIRKATVVSTVAELKYILLYLEISCFKLENFSPMLNSSTIGMVLVSLPMTPTALVLGLSPDCGEYGVNDGLLTTAS